jgi:hypothetical protein
MFTVRVNEGSAATTKPVLAGGATAATFAPMPRHEPEVTAAERRRRRSKWLLVGVGVALFLAFATAQIGWMVVALWR